MERARAPEAGDTISAGARGAGEGGVALAGGPLPGAGGPGAGRTRAAGERKRAATVLARTASGRHSGLEYAAHVAPRGLARDLGAVFPGVALGGLLVVPTFQRAGLALLEYGAREAAEKDRLLERFLGWARAVRAAVIRQDPAAWVDATDPASGLAFFGTPGAPYSDIDGLMRVSAVATTNIGGCHIMRHPEWGFACYPATLFSTAAPDVLLQALSEVNDKVSEKADA